MSTFRIPEASGVLIFDLDNTLVPCSEHYAHANARFLEIMSELFPDIAREEVRSAFDRIDVEVASQGLYGRDRYPSSMVKTYHLYCAQKGIEPSAEVAADIFSVGSYVFQSDLYAPYPGVVDLLRQYRDAGYRIGLCTKGEEEIQYGIKIDPHGLRDLFEEGGIRVVRFKTADEVGGLAKRLGADKGVPAYMIGDSLRDDIQSGNQAGVTTVLVSSGVDHSWSYENGFEHVVPTHVVDQVIHLPSVIPLP